jgi:hypothetical protein
MRDDVGIVITCILIGSFMARKIYSIGKTFIIYVKLRANGYITQGTVTKIDRKPLTLISRGGDAPVFKFQTSSRQIVEGVPLNCVYCSPSFYKIGERYTLFYDNSDPKNFMIKKWTEIWLLAFVFLVYFGFFAISVWGIIK